MPENTTWKDLVTTAYFMHVDLSARYWVKPDKFESDTLPFKIPYEVYATACSEVLVDVLTGEMEVTRTDILYDGGQS